MTKKNESENATTFHMKRWAFSQQMQFSMFEHIQMSTCDRIERSACDQNNFVGYSHSHFDFNLFKLILIEK